MTLLYENIFLNVDGNDIKNNESINNLEKSDKNEGEAEEIEDNKDASINNKINEGDFDLEKNLINFKKKEIDNILEENFKDNEKMIIYIMIIILEKKIIKGHLFLILMKIWRFLLH